jgi:glycogen debranching enzyme
MFETPVFRDPKPWRERYDTHVENPWVSQNRFISAQPDGQELPDFSQAREKLPEPFWTGHAEAIACYWRAWELAFGNLKQPTHENDFAANYCDTAFNGNLFMWDSAFVTCYGSYGRRAFNFQGTLDTFYRKQHADGFICREIAETDGQDTFHRFDPSSTGPNVLAWAEWDHFLKSGDRQRLEQVFPALVGYHQWTRKFRSWPDGSYWSTGWGQGMDNLPRVRRAEHVNFDNGHLVWVDATFQASLSAKVLLKMAALIGRQTEVEDLAEELGLLNDYCNRYLWNVKNNFYCDRYPDGELSPMKHIGAYWALLAGSVPAGRAPDFVAHLDNPSEFKRAHRIPALSADDPAFSGSGDYWCGGVWAPTNYMVLKGLDEIGQPELAHQIALNHLENVVKVFESEDIRWEGAEQFRQYFHLADLKYDDKHTLWENYAPDVIRPGGHSKPGYVGWTGLPPIAVLLEDVFGIAPDAVSNRLTWRVHLLEEHGVRRYPFGLNGMLDLKCAPRNSRLERPSIEIHANIPISLEVIWEGGTDTLNIEKEN